MSWPALREANAFETANHQTLANDAPLLKLASGMPWPPARDANARQPCNPNTDDQHVGMPAFRFQENVLITPWGIIADQAVANGVPFLKLAVGMPWPPARDFSAPDPYQLGTPAYCFRDIIFATPRSTTYQPLWRECRRPKTNRQQLSTPAFFFFWKNILISFERGTTSQALINGVPFQKLAVGMPWPPARDFSAPDPYVPVTQMPSPKNKLPKSYLGAPAYCFRNNIFRSPWRITTYQAALGMLWPPARDGNALEPYKPKPHNQQLGTPAYSLFDKIQA